MVNITIDGKLIEVPEGTTVLGAARLGGIEIPTLCDHPHLTPYGGCRLCLVEIEGARTLQPSCTMPASNNMVVHTDTAKVRDARKFVLTLIFSERNHFCMYCQVSGGDCELQNAAYREGMTNWPLVPNWQSNAVDASHPYFILENNRCILCRRCVRACGELAGNFTLGFEERGAKSFLVADLGTPLGQSTCVACGACVDVCPTGALIDRWSAYRGKDVQTEKHQTVCVGCSIGCGITVLTRDNSVVRIEGDWDAPINGGVLCKTGKFLPMAEDRQRLATPLVRKDGVLKAATWEEALTAAVAHLKPGKDGVAALASTRLPAEALYAFKQIFSGKLQSSMVTSLEEGQPTAVAASMAEEIGKPFEGTLDDLDHADAFMAIGVNLVDSHEVAGFFIKRALPSGAKLVVIDPAENPLDMLADKALKSKADDQDVILALSAAVVKLGLAKTDSAIKPEILDSLAAKTGISANDYLAAAQAFASAEKPVIVYGKGITTRSATALKALVGFARLTGASLISAKSGANSLAAGQYHMDQVFQMNGQQAAFVALADDTPSQRLIQRLEKAPFVVVMASYASQLTSMADVVFPVTTWAEQEGHYLSLDGHLQKGTAVLSAPEDILTCEAALNGIAAHLGATLATDWKEQLHERVAPVAIVEG
jgi:formate dehydrogenase major subunit